LQRLFDLVAKLDLIMQQNPKIFSFATSPKRSNLFVVSAVVVTVVSAVVAAVGAAVVAALL